MNMPFLFHLLLVLAFLAGSLDPSWAEKAQDVQAQDDQGCLIRDVRYTARLAEPALQGSLGEPVGITVRIEPTSLPTGYFVSTNIRVLSAPASPDILPGFPVTTVVCPEPGEYVLELTTSLLTKSSCGGVSACSLPEERVILRIEPIRP